MKMISSMVRDTGWRCPMAGARPGRVTSTRCSPSRALRSLSRISPSRRLKASSRVVLASFAEAPTFLRSSRGREVTPFRNSEMAPFFPK